MGADRTSTGGRHPKDPASDGFLIVDMLDQMLQKNPKERATIPELKVRDILCIYCNTTDYIMLEKPLDPSWHC